MYQKVVLIGNLGKDPEIRHLEGGIAVAKFSVATNESYKDQSGEWQQNTEWINVVAWRGLAEVAEKYFKKGKMVFVEGKLSTRSWEDEQGKKRYATDVVASKARLLEKKESDSFNGMTPPPETAYPSPNKSEDGFISPDPISKPDEEEDDLPF